MEITISHLILHLLEDFSEPNDVIAQATDISVGDSYRGIITSKYFSDEKISEFL